MSSHDDCKGCREYHQLSSQLSRRRFLGVGAGFLTAAALPGWLPRVVYADSENSSRDVIVSIFLRGGADGLSLCVPHGEAAYYNLRPTLAIAPPDSSDPARRVTDLDGFFGLPPAFAPLLPAYQNGDLAIVHACGLPDTSRSHFSAMHFMEVGQENPPISLGSGWLGRHLQITAPAQSQALLRAVGIGFGLQQTLVGAPEALPIADLARFGLAGDPASLADRRLALETMVAGLDDAMGRATRHTLATIDLLGAIDFEGYQPTGGAVYSAGELGTALASTAALIKADVGVEAVAIDVGGWDTHDFQGPVDGAMAGLMGGFGQALAAFHSDLFAAGYENIVVVAQSEFGRNAFENGSAGTDHGHGGVMMVLGGAIAGGRVHGVWPGLAPDQLFDGQDLAITTDYRDILSEILVKRLDNPEIGAVFADPSYTYVERGIVG